MKTKTYHCRKCQRNPVDGPRSVYGAVINGRKAIGVELKSSYYRQAIAYLAEAKNYKPEADSAGLYDSVKEPAETD